MQPLVRYLAPLALALAACATSSPDPSSDASAATDGSDASAALATACPGLATTWLRIDANLDAQATPPTQPWDPSNPGASSNFWFPWTVWLAGGEWSQITVYFRREWMGWSYHVMDETASTPSELGHGALEFDARGALTNAARLTPVQLPDPRTGGTSSLALAISPETRHDGSIESGVVSTDASCNLFAVRADGFGPSTAPCPLAPVW